MRMPQQLRDVLSNPFSMQSIGTISVGTIALGMAANELAKLYQEGAEAEASMEHLAAAIRRAGGTATDIAAVEAEVGRLQESTGKGDDKIREAFGRLMLLSHDTARSMAALPTVLDLATARTMDLEQSAQLVGMAMNGELFAISRILPEFRKLVREHGDLQGTAEGARLAMTTLSEIVGGKAVEAANTAVGSLARMKEATGEARESWIRLVTSYRDSRDMTTDIGTNFFAAAGKIDSFSSAMREAGEAYGRFLTHVPRGVRGLIDEPFHGLLRGPMPLMTWPGVGQFESGVDAATAPRPGFAWPVVSGIENPLAWLPKYTQGGGDGASIADAMAEAKIQVAGFAEACRLAAGDVQKVDFSKWISQEEEQRRRDAGELGYWKSRGWNEEQGMMGVPWRERPEFSKGAAPRGPLYTEPPPEDQERRQRAQLHFGIESRRETDRTMTFSDSEIFAAQDEDRRNREKQASRRILQEETDATRERYKSAIANGLRAAFQAADGSAQEFAKRLGDYIEESVVNALIASLAAKIAGALIPTSTSTWSTVRASASVGRSRTAARAPRPMPPTRTSTPSGTRAPARTSGSAWTAGARSTSPGSGSGITICQGRPSRSSTAPTSRPGRPSGRRP